jgi:hypothetical protein
VVACWGTIDKAAERSTKTTVQLSNIDAGAGGISLTANDKHSNDKHSNDKHAANNLTVAVASVNETLPSLSFLNSSGFLAIVPSTSARLTFTFLCLE